MQEPVLVITILGWILALFIGFIVFICWHHYCCRTESFETMDRQILTNSTLTSWRNYSKDEESNTNVKHLTPQLQGPNTDAPEAANQSTSIAMCTYKSVSPTLHHQAKSYPGGHLALYRTPSVSSQNSVESFTTKSNHRGSSPQIRTFAPDGKTYTHQATVHLPPKKSSSRSPSPLRAASLDIRCTSPSFEIRTPSPSQLSITSVTSSNCSSPIPTSPKSSLTNTRRSLSPLLIPIRTQTPDTSYPLPPVSPLGAIQPDLYTRKDGPLFIEKSPKNGPDIGRLHFRLKYDFDRSDLIVHLIEAHDLTVSDRDGFNDPYVRVLMEPEIDTRKRQTEIYRNDVNPNFDQHFKFPISYEELQSKTIVLQVYGKFTRNDVIGEVRIRMENFDIISSIEVWGDLSQISKPPEEQQEILVSLGYLPSAERLTVNILKARNLFQQQDKDTIDPFVKVYLMVNGKRIKKRKIAAKKCNDPTWNEAVSFTLSPCSLVNAKLEIRVYNQSSDSLLGYCVIGPKESSNKNDIWMDVSRGPKNSGATWYILR